jgi:hypothetical protein
MVYKRDLFKMAILLLITFGLYYFYWLVSTKNEINRLGAEIPTGWLLIVPIANIYFFYKYAEGFSHYVVHDRGAGSIAYFILVMILPIPAIFVCQSKLNKLA